jgi:hypothetical protein
VAQRSVGRRSVPQTFTFQELELSQACGTCSKLQQIFGIEKDLVNEFAMCANGLLVMTCMHQNSGDTS